MDPILEAKTGKDVALYVAKAIALRVVITVGAVLIAEAVIKQIESKNK